MNVFQIHWYLNCSDIFSHFLIVHPPSDLSREIKERCTIGAGWIYNRRVHHTRKKNCAIISHADISPQAIYFCSSADRTKNIISSLLMFLNLLSSNLTSLSVSLQIMDPRLGLYLSHLNYSSELPLLCHQWVPD